MTIFERFTTILEHPILYRTWQIPFAGHKIAMLRRHNNFAELGRVLDVGCGPAMNTRYFAHADYRGIDISERYIADARKRFRKDFLVADIRAYVPPDRLRYDFILLNSLLHHMNDGDTNTVLAQLAHVVSEQGHVHILDLVMPPNPGVPYWLASHDRGKYPRTIECWTDLFLAFFEPVVLERFSISCLGFGLLDMVYFKGRPASGVDSDRKTRQHETHKTTAIQLGGVEAIGDLLKNI